MTDPQSILDAYCFTDRLRSFEPAGNGLINSTCRVVLENGDAYILQEVNTNIFKDPFVIAENTRQLQQYLALHAPGYLFVAPLPVQDGRTLYVSPEKKYYRVFPFIAASRSIDVVASERQAFEAARQFGRFTYLLKDFAAMLLQPPLPDFHNLTLRYRQFNNALQHGNTDRINEVAELAAFLSGQQELVATYTALQADKNFRLRVTHHDTKISNVLFNATDEGLCVIDLDTVMPGYFISDVGDMMRTYLCPVAEDEADTDKVRINEKYFEAIVKGYGGEMREVLTAQEKAHFVYAGKFMVYMQALRFLTDYCNGDIYYSIRYEKHNLVRATNQACLLQQIMRHGPVLDAIVAEYLK